MKTEVKFHDYTIGIFDGFIVAEEPTADFLIIQGEGKQTFINKHSILYAKEIP